MSGLWAAQRRHAVHLAGCLQLHGNRTHLDFIPNMQSRKQHYCSCQRILCFNLVHEDAPFPKHLGMRADCQSVRTCCATRSSSADAVPLPGVCPPNINAAASRGPLPPSPQPAVSAARHAGASSSAKESSRPCNAQLPAYGILAGSVHACRVRWDPGHGKQSSATHRFDHKVVCMPCRVKIKQAWTGVARLLGSVPCH